MAQMAAFREWEQVTGERFTYLKSVRQPTLVVNGIHDEMISVSNSYLLAENLPNAVLLVYPDSGHWLTLPISRVLYPAGRFLFGS
jgi:pimeloyl-ACP methyl ester carboxylesterase